MASTHSNASPIGDFYQDKCILVTGATGFVGKVLVEKLLRSCLGVKRIYVLIRHKKGFDHSQRLAQILESKLFDVIRFSSPELLTKIVAIHGDVTHDSLGLSCYTTNTLVDEINVVFHSAAATRFNDPLNIAVKQNLIGTANVLALCHKMTNLEALVHVSTAYSHCVRTNIDEEIYEMQYSPGQIMNAMEWMSDEMVAKIEANIIGDWPNTYSFTKALTETYLAQECTNFPIAIVRPSIIAASWKEPFPGWIDNYSGTTGLIVAGGKGLLRTVLADPDCVCDLIPVDVVVNMLIASAWSVSSLIYNNVYGDKNNVTIFHCTSGSVNKLTFGNILILSLANTTKYPSAVMVRHPHCTYRTSPLMNKLVGIFYHHVPAHLYDLIVCRLTGKKPFMVKMVSKVELLLQTQHFFLNNEWRFSSINSDKLLSTLQAADKANFSFDLRTLDWTKYWVTYVLGIRQYLFKEDMETLPNARRQLKRRLYLNNVIMGLISMIVLCGVFASSISAFFEDF